MTSGASNSPCRREPASGPGTCAVGKVSLVPSEPLFCFSWHQPVRKFPADPQCWLQSGACPAWLTAAFQQGTLVLSPTTGIVVELYLALSKGMGGGRGGWGAEELGRAVGKVQPGSGLRECCSRQRKTSLHPSARVSEEPGLSVCRQAQCLISQSASLALHRLGRWLMQPLS